jgi:hypothetical protein
MLAMDVARISRQVLVNDPWQGGQYWVSKGVFEGSWAVFGNMAVVVQ